MRVMTTPTSLPSRVAWCSFLIERTVSIIAGVNIAKDAVRWKGGVRREKR